MARDAMILWRNLVAENGTLLTSYRGAAGEASSMRASYLATPEPSDRARVTYLDPESTRWLAALTIEHAVRGVALVGTNVGPYAEWRIVFANSGGIPQNPATEPITSAIGTSYVMERMPPTGTVSSSNVAANPHLALDEDPRTPGGDWVTPTTSTSPWSVTLSFGTPGTVDAGPNHAVTLWVRKVSSTGSTLLGETNPEIEVELWEAGAYVKTLGVREVTSSTGQWLIFPFDSADLADGSMADLQVTVIGRFSTGWADSARWYVEADACSVYVDGGPGLPITVGHDTGWMTVPAESQRAAGRTTRDLVWLPESTDPGYDAAANQVLIMIRDDGVLYRAGESASPPAYPRTTNVGSSFVPDQFHEAGVMVVVEGEGVWTTDVAASEVGVGPGGFENRIEFARVEKTRGGQVTGSTTQPARSWNMTWDTLTVDRAAQLYDLALRLAGTSPVLLVADPDDQHQSPLNQRQGIAWVLIRSITEGYPTVANRRRVTLGLEEKR